VRAEPVLDELDQGRVRGVPPVSVAVVRSRPLGRLPRDRVARERVHAVDADTVEAVGGRLPREGVCRGLARLGGRDGPTVVVTAEHGRRVEHAREVHRLVEVALARRAVPEVTGDDPVLLPVVERPRRADRVREVRRDPDVQREDVPVGDRLGPGFVAHPVGEVLGEQVADDGRAVFAVLVGDEIVGRERVGRPDRRALLTRAGRVRPDPPLSLEADRALVEPARGDQVVVDRPELVVREVGDRRVRQGLAVRVEDAIDILVREGIGHRVGGAGRVSAVLVHWRSVCGLVTRI